MKIIICLDNNKGMCFNGRRVSKDRVVTEKIMELTAGSQLWISPFSEKLFDGVHICADEYFLRKAKDNDYCFVENERLEAVRDRISELTVFWWNRHYPSDLKLDLDLSEFQKVSEEEFLGYSHEKVTKEVYVR